MAQPERYHVALFVPTLAPGGVEKVVLNLARGLTDAGHKVDLLVGNAKGALRETVPPSVRLVDFARSRVLWSVPRLVQYIRREKPHVIIAAMTHTSLSAILAAQMAGGRTQVIATEHIDMGSLLRDSNSSKVSLMPALGRIFFKRACAVVAVSQGVAASVAYHMKIPASKIFVIYNPVIAPEIRELAKQKPEHRFYAQNGLPIVLAAGRLASQKDFPTLIRAFAKLRQQHDARLLILGEGEERGHLEGLIRELGEQEYIELFGYSANPYAHMARAKLFVLSSIREGFGLVLVEALAMGAKVISTDCESGPREILENGKWGTLVPVGDCEQLAGAMSRALTAPPQPVDPSWLSQFEIQPVTEAYVRLIQQCVNAQPAPN